MTNYKKTFKIFQRLSAADTAHLCKELSIADSQMIGHAARALALACKIYSWDGYTEENKQKIYRQFLTENAHHEV